MENKILNFGIIGCGMISNWHADAINQISQAKLIGATDINENNRNAFAAKYNIVAYDSVECLLDDPNINVVSICTPSGLHAPLALKAASKGKHIILEKPMALNLKEADEIIDACEKNNVLLTVISQLRFSRDVVILKDLIKKGTLGKLITGGISMKYYRSQEYYDKSAWRGTWKMDGGGAVMNQGIHGIDLLLYIMGPIKSVYANSKTLDRNIEVEDTSVAILEYSNGALGTIEATTSVYPGFLRRLEICGTKGSIILEENSIIYCQVQNEDYSHYIKAKRSSNALANDPKAISVSGHTMQITDMVNAILNNSKPFIDAYEGRKAIEVISAIYKSSTTGELIKL